MQSNNADFQELQHIPQHIPGPPQLPPLIRGQKLKSGPYTITVTDDMVARRERENLELYRAWVQEQRRRHMLPQEDADEYMGDFKDAMIRRSFVRKVFCLLTLQLIFTIAIIAIFMFSDEAQKFMIIHWYLWIVAMMFFIVAYCAIACSVHARRTAPFNYICLFLLTLGMSYLAAFVSVFYSIEVILVVLGMTVAVTTIIIFVATFTKFDLTMRPGLLMVVGLVAIVAIFTMIIVMLFTHIMILRMVIAMIGSLLLCMYLYFDVQTIMGGRRIALDPDEIVFATTQIYVDIILLYQYLLMFVGFFHH